MEHISGPHNGYFIATRAAADGDGWIAHARIYDCRPDSYDDVNCVAMLISDKEHRDSAEAAVAHARGVALKRAAAMAAPGG